VLAKWFRITDEMGQYLSAAEFRELQKLVARIQTKIDNNTTQSRR
jgi:ribosomal protein L29